MAKKLLFLLDTILMRVMVWGGICRKGKIDIQFLEVIKSFLEIIFPDWEIRSMVTIDGGLCRIMPTLIEP